MATVTIYISKQKDSKGLHFTDSEGHSGDNTITTKVKPGDTVIWKLTEEGGIDAITAISEVKSKNNQNLFVESPKPIDPKNPESDWIAEIKETATGKETYTISYKIDDNVYTQHPDSDSDPEPKPNHPDLEVDP